MTAANEVAIVILACASAIPTEPSAVNPPIAANPFAVGLALLK
jgi:hypothetical protein